VFKVLPKCSVIEKTCEEGVHYVIVYKGQEIGVLKEKVDLSKLELGSIKGEGSLR